MAITSPLKGFSNLERQNLEGFVVDGVTLRISPNFTEMGGIADIEIKFSDDGILHVGDPTLLEPPEEIFEGALHFP